MRDVIKSFLMGAGFATGFFAAISFTADAELDAAQEQAIFLEGVQYGAREATINKQCGWRDQFREPVKELRALGHRDLREMRVLAILNDAILALEAEGFGV